MKMEDVAALSPVKDTACHILINTFIWGHFSSGCCTATETLRLRGDGDLNSLLLFLSLHSLVVCTTAGACVLILILGVYVTLRVEEKKCFPAALMMLFLSKVSYKSRSHSERLTSHTSPHV